MDEQMVQRAIRVVQGNLDVARTCTTPEEFQTILQWLQDFVTVNRESRSEEPE